MPRTRFTACRGVGHVRLQEDEEVAVACKLPSGRVVGVTRLTASRHHFVWCGRPASFWAPRECPSLRRLQRFQVAAHPRYLLIGGMLFKLIVPAMREAGISSLGVKDKDTWAPVPVYGVQNNSARARRDATILRVEPLSYIITRGLDIEQL